MMFRAWESITLDNRGSVSCPEGRPLCLPCNDRSLCSICFLINFFACVYPINHYVIAERLE